MENINFKTKCRFCGELLERYVNQRKCETALQAYDRMMLVVQYGFIIAECKCKMLAVHDVLAVSRKPKKIKT